MKPAKPRRSLLSFLPLEDRTVPALVSWDGGGGNLLWATPANWSGDTLPGAADDVVIDTTFADKTISLGITTKVASLNSASNITVTSTGTLDVSGANPDVPAIAKNLIIEGTLRNTITSSGTPVSVRNNGVLDGVTIASGGTLRVGTNGSSGVVAIARNGLTLNGRLFLGDFYSSQIRFEGSQTLSGTGTVTMEGTNGFSAFNGLYADQTLTISEGITINGTNGFVGNTGSTTINRGIIRASGGGTISLSGDHPLSSGLLDTASDGRLTLTGTLAGSGVVNIGDNATLTVGSTGVLKGVTVNKKIHVSQGSVLDGVTITSGGTLRVGTNGSSGVVAIARNGLTLNGRLFLGDFYSSQIRFEGSQTLSGTGTVTMEGTNGFSAFNGLYADQTLTISEGITINGTNGFVGTQSGTTVNNGLIHASAEGGTITTFGTFTNNGELRATGGTIDARNLTNLDSNGVLTGGRYTFNANGRLRVARGITSIDSTFTLADPTASVVAGSGTTEALTELTGITAAGQFTLTGGRYCTFIALECGPVGAGVRQCGDTHRGVQQHRAIHHAGQWGK